MVNILLLIIYMYDYLFHLCIHRNLTFLCPSAALLALLWLFLAINCQ